MLRARIEPRQLYHRDIPNSTTIATTNKAGEIHVFDVTDGSVFEIVGPFNEDNDFLLADGTDCFIHTSRSVPLVAGDQTDPFVVLEGNECKYETPAPSHCPVCPTQHVTNHQSFFFSNQKNIHELFLLSIGATGCHSSLVADLQMNRQAYHPIAHPQHRTPHAQVPAWRSY